MDTIDLKTLVGPHTLSGCDIATEQIKDWGEMYVSSGVIRFILDEKTYAAVEDPDDGYRSSLRYLHLSDAAVENQFPPVEVYARHRDRVRSEYGGSSDVLEIYNPSTGKIILEIGTDDEDDYYPGCVMGYYPENLP